MIKIHVSGTLGCSTATSIAGNTRKNQEGSLCPCSVTLSVFENQKVGLPYLIKWPYSILIYHCVARSAVSIHALHNLFVNCIASLHARSIRCYTLQASIPTKTIIQFRFPKYISHRFREILGPSCSKKCTVYLYKSTSFALMSDLRSSGRVRGHV